MANDCLVTKLKGTVDNPNLPYFGQVKIILRDNTYGYQGFAIYPQTGESFDYIISGVDSLTFAGNTVPLSGTLNAGGEFKWTGAGTAIIKSKYSLTTISANSAAKIADMNEVAAAYLPENCKLRHYASKCFYESIDKDVVLYNLVDSNPTLGVKLPLIKNMDYSHVSVGLNTNRIEFNAPVRNEFGLTGDLGNLLNVGNITPEIPLFIECYEEGVTINNINPFADYKVVRWSTHSNLVYGDVETIFSNWGTNFTNGDILTIKPANNVNWNNVFDAWSAKGIKDFTYNFYVTGTLNGQTLTVLTKRIVTFDNNGNWSVTEG